MAKKSSCELNEAQQSRICNFYNKKSHLKNSRLIANKKLAPNKNKGRANFISATSSDGWKIFMGRNRIENDRLLSELAQPNDVWLHVLGQTGSHVLIKLLPLNNSLR